MTLRALGGGPLRGDNLARFVYLDEAGTGKDDPWLVVGGVIVHGDKQLDRLYEALAEIQKKVPEDKRDTHVLHTCDIYGGNGPVFDKERFPEWNWERRSEILTLLGQLPEKLNLFVTVGWVERTDFPHTPDYKLTTSSIEGDAHVCAYVGCLMEVDLWFRQNRKGENCMIVAEDHKERKQVLKEMQQHYQDPKICAEMEERHRFYFPFQRIREDPSFQEKKPKHPLILADYIAFIMKRRLMNDRRASPFFDLWKKRMAGHSVQLSA